MSVISEALKKAQNISQTTPPESPPTLRRPEPVKKRPEKRSIPLSIVITAYALITFIFLSVALVYFIKQQTAQNKFTDSTLSTLPRNVAMNRGLPMRAVPNPAMRKRPVALLSTPSAPMSAQPASFDETIKLNGIMYTPEKPLAVINDNVWSEGEYIGIYQIVDIGKDFIKLDANGQEFVIMLKR